MQGSCYHSSSLSRPASSSPSPPRPYGRVSSSSSLPACMHKGEEESLFFLLFLSPFSSFSSFLSFFLSSVQFSLSFTDLLLFLLFYLHHLCHLPPLSLALPNWNFRAPEREKLFSSSSPLLLSLAQKIFPCLHHVLSTAAFLLFSFPIYSICLPLSRFSRDKKLLSQGEVRLLLLHFSLSSHVNYFCREEKRACWWILCGL